MIRHRSSKSAPARPSRSAKGAAAISEFALVLYVLFFIILVPVVDLGCLMIGAATQYLATNDFAEEAASQPDYINSLNAMFVESEKFATTGMSKFMHMTPQGGYVGTGNDLYVVTTNIASGGVQKSAANNSISPPIDTAANIYELSVNSKYSFDPVLNLSGVPVLGNVPGLGKPVTFSFVANRPMEHPGGLAANGTTQNQGNAALLPRNTAPGALPSTGASDDWRTPNIYQQIANSGQTIISSNVVIVQANNENWTPSGLNVNPSDKVWIDTQAVGQWNVGGSYGFTDANGLGAQGGSQSTTSPFGSLVAKVGTGTAFTLGDGQTNLAVTGSGMLTMIMNDGTGCFDDNNGAQIVRIIVTQ